MLGHALGHAAGLLVMVAGWSDLPARADTAPAAPPELNTPGTPTYRLQGQGRFRYFGLTIYTARLWAAAEPVGRDFAQQRFALELIYARALDGAAIAERSLAEMRRAGPIDSARAARWLAAMQAPFPDVTAGDRLTGVFDPAAPGGSAAVRFFLNGRTTGAVAEAEFAVRFAAIWLGPATSAPELRLALLGSAP
ncbi:MAG: hypothetical protein RLY71_3144 [Pseudomonadota bacterium]|jgi:hypothetical protein